MSERELRQLKWSEHAMFRVVDRQLLEEHINFVLRNGSSRPSWKGRHKVRIRQGDLPFYYRRDALDPRIVEIVVILDSQKRTVVTVFRRYPPC